METHRHPAASASPLWRVLRTPLLCAAAFVALFAVASSGAFWDAAGAASFGFRVVWINRYRQPVEHLPARPEMEIETLEPLPGLLGLAAA